MRGGRTAPHTIESSILAQIGRRAASSNRHTKKKVVGIAAGQAEAAKLCFDANQNMSDLLSVGYLHRQ